MDIEKRNALIEMRYSLTLIIVSVSTTINFLQNDLNGVKPSTPQLGKLEHMNIWATEYCAHITEALRKPHVDLQC